MILTIIITICVSLLLSEFVGYWIHCLFHNEHIPFLSRSHMIHHMVQYAPDADQRTRGYYASVKGRFSILGAGIEYIIPALIWLVVVFGVCIPLGFNIIIPCIVVSVFYAYAYFLFGEMHGAMHIRGYWMLHNRLLRNWFAEARRLHDIHHIELSPDGRMNRNYGICFFVMDKIFGTFEKEENEFFNEYGLNKAKVRYADILK